MNGDTQKQSLQRPSTKRTHQKSDSMGQLWLYCAQCGLVKPGRYSAECSHFNDVQDICELCYYKQENQVCQRCPVGQNNKHCEHRCPCHKNQGAVDLCILCQDINIDVFECQYCLPGFNHHCPHSCPFHRRNADVCSLCFWEKRENWTCHLCPDQVNNHCDHFCPHYWKNADLCHECFEINNKMWICRYCPKGFGNHCDHMCPDFRQRRKRRGYWYCKTCSPVQQEHYRKHHRRSSSGKHKYFYNHMDADVGNCKMCSHNNAGENCTTGKNPLYTRSVVLYIDIFWFLFFFGSLVYFMICNLIYVECNE